MRLPSDHLGGSSSFIFQPFSTGERDLSKTNSKGGLKRKNKREGLGATCNLTEQCGREEGTWPPVLYSPPCTPHTSDHMLCLCPVFLLEQEVGLPVHLSPSGLPLSDTWTLKPQRSPQRTQMLPYQGTYPEKLAAATDLPCCSRGGEGPLRVLVSSSVTQMSSRIALASIVAPSHM